MSKSRDVILITGSSSVSRSLQSMSDSQFPLSLLRHNIRGKMSLGFVSTAMSASSVIALAVHPFQELPFLISIGVECHCLDSTSLSRIAFSAASSVIALTVHPFQEVPFLLSISVECHCLDSTSLSRIAVSAFYRRRVSLCWRYIPSKNFRDPSD